MLSERDRRDQQAALRWSLGVGAVLLIAKCGAAWLTGSAAIFSDAAESVVHLGAVAFAAFSYWLTQQPARRGSPYGYGRIAFFSAGFEGGMIMLAAFGIFWVALRRLQDGATMEQLGAGTILTLAAATVNLLLGWHLVRTGRRTNSLILEANGHHVLTDCWTSFGVVGGLGLVLLTGWTILDPLAAIAVAANILWTAARLMVRSVRGLLDLTDSKTDRLLREHAAAICDELGIGHHLLRSRDAGDHIFVEVHLLFPQAMPIGEAHALATRFEEALAGCVDFPVEVATHLEAIEDHAAVHPSEPRDWAL